MIPRLPAWQPGGSVVKDSRGTRVMDAPTREARGGRTAVALQGAAAGCRVRGAPRSAGGTVLRAGPIGETLGGWCQAMKWGGRPDRAAAQRSHRDLPGWGSGGRGDRF